VAVDGIEEVITDREQMRPRSEIGLETFGGLDAKNSMLFLPASGSTGSVVSSIVRFAAFFGVRSGGGCAIPDSSARRIRR